MKLLILFLCLIIVENSLFAQTIVDRIQPVELFKPMIETGGIAGVVTLLATKDSIISLEAAGYSNIEKSTQMTTDNIFWVASQTKPIITPHKCRSILREKIWEEENINELKK